MMRRLSLAQVAELMNGRVRGSGEVDNVVIDSRKARAGSLFFALPGERVDGHQFVGDVLAMGGCAVVREGAADQPGVVEVADPLLALQDLAQNYLATYRVPVVAVTGSNGKTTTKDMIAQVLRCRYSVHATEGNMNNEIGVPLTVLGLEEHHEVLVVEMGMRGLGQIRRLAEICPPNLGIITNIGPVHLEILGGISNVAQAKGELLEAMDSSGTAVLNGDDPTVRGQARSFSGRIVYYGLDAANELVAKGIRLDGEGHPSCLVSCGGEEVALRLAVPGVHNVWNALAALAVGLQFGVSLRDGASALETLTLSAMRLEVRRSPSGVVVVNDSYNASPASMKGALDTLAHMYCSGERVAILGTMLELGEISEQAHFEVGRHAGECAQRLFFVGEFAEVMRQGAGRGEVYATVEEFLAELPGFEDGDLVLVKASRGLHFERIADQLLKGGV
ncbi:MAG TPA: UDP-N-acetylmuramoyl-tripeptide--D-alanyl-D-alanine ligase [Firmicutes bacterium]|jgi:UDP-N-acetylmuramoyl-tripeptide--D-alanyl-D-alanine ligase|nr:UDP-N-acetylmuramoyl-tripeptide--D-alanyl-D-alanine ligase [Bacillota bacterium]